MDNRADDTEGFSIIELPIADGFAQAVRSGLSRRPRSIPPRFSSGTLLSFPWPTP